MIIVDLIKEMMYQQDKTIKDMVKETGLSYTIVENVVKRNIVPKPEDAKLMLAVFNIKLEDVLCLY